MQGSDSVFQNKTTVNLGYNKPFCTLANGSLYPGMRCTGRDFTCIHKGGAHRERLLHEGFVVEVVCCIQGSL